MSNQLGGKSHKCRFGSSFDIFFKLMGSYDIDKIIAENQLIFEKLQ